MTQMQDMAKSVNPALEHFTPQGFEKLWPTMPASAMEGVMGKTFNPQGLDAKTRLLLTLAGLTAQGAVAEPQVRLTVRHCKEAGATDQEIAEAIGMMGLFAGLPAMNKAMGLAAEVLREGRE
jgi:4-carboxymuconolactone decarboxylase